MSSTGRKGSHPKTQAARSEHCWPRLRIVEVQPPTAAAELAQLITALDSGRALREDERRLAAAWLRRLATTPSARQALQSQGRGRPRSDNSPDIALDYRARKELLGKASAARAAVAKAWGVSEATVKDAWTEWRAGAEWRLNVSGNHAAFCFSFR